jgi:hypothetical protein
MSTADQGPISLLAAMRQGDCALGISPDLRAILTSHVTLQLVDRRSLWPADNVQRHRPVGVAAEAADLKVEISRVQRVAEAGRGLSRSFESEHALVPGDTRQTVSFLPSLGRALRRMPNRTAVDALARFGAHQGKNAPAWVRSASRYGWAWNRIQPPPVAGVEKSPRALISAHRRLKRSDTDSPTLAGFSMA